MKMKGSFQDYGSIRDYLKEGPPAFVREDWASEFVGQTVEVKELVDRCGPCMESAPLISDLADKHAGKIAFIGKNNDAIFGPDKSHDIEKITAVLETKKGSCVTRLS
ncbi:hypothetical protein BGZ83_002081 [Gryganskiella cystojenkinii]|nr:hypothetical protein BGZ83_002081 [Gryganskiella cystojenkinii]